MTKVDRPIFVLHLRPERGVDAIRALRGLLKVALRCFQLRCISCSEDLPRKSEE